MNIAAQDSALAHAPPHWLSKTCQRFVVVANDERISEAGFQSLKLSSEDVLVQFNKLMHFDRFADTRCHKVFVFQRNGVGSYWGFDTEGRIKTDLFRQQRASLCAAFTMRLDAVVDEFIASLPSDATAMCFNPWAIPLFAVPKGRVPSVGFVSNSLFHHVNLVRAWMGLPPARIVTLGFTGRYSRKKRFDGHDFEFEQTVMSTWPDLLRLGFDGERLAEPPVSRRVPNRPA